MKKIWGLIIVLIIALGGISFGFFNVSSEFSKAKQTISSQDKELNNITTKLSKSNESLEEKDKQINSLNKEVSKIKKELSEQDNETSSYNAPDTYNTTNSYSESQHDAAAQENVPNSNNSYNENNAEQRNDSPTAPSNQYRVVTYDGSDMKEFAGSYGMTMQEFAEANGFSDPQDIMLVKGQNVLVK